MVLWQKAVAPFSEYKGGVGSFLKIPESNSEVGSLGLIWRPTVLDRREYQYLMIIFLISRPNHVMTPY